MALPIERWAKQAVDLERKGDLTPAPDTRILANDKIEEFKALGFMQWREREKAIRDSGDPIALEGLYAGVEAMPPAGTLANVASVSGENAMWGTALWTPIPANVVMTPKAYRVSVMYQVITSTSPASVTYNPRLGAFASGASTTGGVQLGASAALALTASITANFWTIGDLTLRAVGIPGTNSTAMGVFHTMSKDTAAGNGVIVNNQIYGFTAGSYDSSIATGFVQGNANTVTTINYSVLGIHWSSWN